MKAGLKLVLALLAAAAFLDAHAIGVAAHASAAHASASHASVSHAAPARSAPAAPRPAAPATHTESALTSRVSPFNVNILPVTRSSAPSCSDERRKKGDC